MMKLLLLTKHPPFNRDTKVHIELFTAFEADAQATQIVPNVYSD